MFRSIVSAIALFWTLAAAPGLAQAADRSAGPEAMAQSERAKFCKGTVRGHRWFLTTSSPVTVGVIDVQKNGRVMRQTKANLKARSTAFGTKNIRGGRLFDNDPVFKKGAPNRCFASGVIKASGGHIIEIFNAFIPRGGGTIAGRCVIDGIHQTACTLSRH